MNVIRGLFIRRLKENMKTKWSHLRLAVDWVVWLYIIVPLLLILLYEYMMVWNGQALWPRDIPILVLLTGLYVISWIGNARVFVESADQLFFRQFTDLYSRLIRFGLSYSFIVAFFTTILLYSAILPIFIVYQNADWTIMILLFLLIYLFRLHIFLLKHYLDATVYGLKKKLFYACIWLIGLAGFHGIVYLGNVQQIWYFALILFLAITLIMVARRRAYAGWSFLSDCDREWNVKFRIAKFLISMAAYSGALDFHQKKGSSFKKPFIIIRRFRYLFMQKKRLYFLLLFFKYMLRDMRRFSQISLINGVCLLAVIFLPANFKYAMWGLSILIILYFLKKLWDEMLSSKFMSLFTWQMENFHKYGRFAVGIHSLPGIGIISFVTGMLNFSILVGILFVLVAVPISLFAVGFFMLESQEVYRQSNY